jgi:hypothetical protein
VRAFVEPIATVIADAIVERLRVMVAVPPSQFYDAHSSPLPHRTFLNAARAHKFPSFRVGKTVFASREDVDNFIRSHRRTPKQPTDDDDGALLDGAGVRRARALR